MQVLQAATLPTHRIKGLMWTGLWVAHQPFLPLYKQQEELSAVSGSPGRVNACAWRG